MMRSVNSRYDIPFGGDFKIDGFSPVFPTQIVDYILIFHAIESTCTIYKVAAGTQCEPKVIDDFALTFGTFFDKSHAPLSNSFRVFAHHSLSGTGNIGGDNVECLSHLCNAGSVATAYNATIVAPFDKVLSQNDCA